MHVIVYVDMYASERGVLLECIIQWLTCRGSRSRGKGRLAQSHTFFRIPLGKLSPLPLPPS